MTKKDRHFSRSLCLLFNFSSNSLCDMWLVSADKQTEIDLPLLRIEDADAEKTPTRQTGIMSSISGVRRLQLQGASCGGELPRYGVDVEDETSLAQVTTSRPVHSG